MRRSDPAGRSRIECVIDNRPRWYPSRLPIGRLPRNPVGTVHPSIQDTGWKKRGDDHALPARAFFGMKHDRFVYERLGSNAR